MVVVVTDVATNGLVVAGEALPTTLTSRIGDAEVEVALPKADGALPAWHLHGRDDERTIGQQAWRAKVTRWAEVLVVRVVVRLPQVIQGEKVAFGEPHDEESVTAAFEAALHGMRPAVKATQGLLEHARVLDQPWLGLGGQEPAVVDGPHIYDDRDPAHPRRLATSSGPHIVVYTHDDEVALSREKLRQAWVAAVEQQQPQLADVILADARHLLRDLPVTTRQVLLLAAVASEVRIKASLQEFASAEQQPLVSLLLERPRDFSMAAAALVDLPLKALTGRSLKEDNRDLFKAVDKLFQDRNRVAHRGGGRNLTLEDARSGAAAAVSLAAYFAEVQTSLGQPRA